MRYLIKETLPFVQFSSVKVTDAFNPLFDIESRPEKTLKKLLPAISTKPSTKTIPTFPIFLTTIAAWLKTMLLAQQV